MSDGGESSSEGLMAVWKRESLRELVDESKSWMLARLKAVDALRVLLLVRGLRLSKKIGVMKSKIFN